MRKEQGKILFARCETFLQRLKNGMAIVDTTPLEAEYRLSSHAVPFAKRYHGEYNTITSGQSWGKPWDCAWFHLSGKVPESWRGKHVAARLNFGGEACVFDKDGCPRGSLTNNSIYAASYCKEIYHLFESCEGGESVELWLDVAANDLFGIKREEEPPPHGSPERYGTYEPKVSKLELVIFDTELHQLMLDCEVLLSLMRYLPEKGPRRSRVLRTMNQAIDVFAGDRNNSAAARKILSAAFATPANASDLHVSAVGHAHIDTGWLWPVAETIRKCARTFSNQIDLLERYPDYIFGASQPQHYAFVKEYYPALYEKIRQYVQQGRWELQGAGWVESDCNITGGEALIRQIIHGKNFWMDEFGVDVRNLWLPDAFGYSAALPQIMKKAGVDYFLSQKISWSQFNEFPHHTFQWQGIDGSRVLAHFLPENTYNTLLDPKELGEGQDRFKENSYIDEYLSLFGIGNGGGGPNEEYVERGLRCRDLEGCPKVNFGRADSFFDRLRQHESALETWSGELYLEFHRGTLTTQSMTKRNNRKLELKLRETEFLCACLPLNEYPSAKLDAVWKKLLLNQFHDILPGSSITTVYQITEREHAEALAECDRLIAVAADKLCHRDKDKLTALNTLSTTFHGVIQLPPGWHGAIDNSGHSLPVQEENGNVLALVDIPPQHFQILQKADNTVIIQPISGNILENDLIRYEFSSDGTLLSAWDKEAHREVIPAGTPGSLLSLYADQPNICDAWDIDVYYENQLLENARCTRIIPLGHGHVRATLQLEFEIGKTSKIHQTISLSANSKRLDFVTEVDWHEHHRMLRVAFPVDILASNAGFDIQYGYLERPTHRNTGWDMAKFEVVAHRYADLSEADYGAALLNDCKYGYKVCGNVLDLNLLRSPSDPDPDADQGKHLFTYSFLPHIGALTDSSVMAESASLNQPPLLLPEYDAYNTKLPCSVTGEKINWEVLKRAEKEDCHVIRLAETTGQRCRAIITPSNANTSICETDLMEWHDQPSFPIGPVDIELKPFEIRTFKLRQ